MEILHQSVLIKQAQKEIKTLLEQSFYHLNPPLDWEDQEVNVVQLEVLVSSLERIINYCENFVAIDKFCKAIRQLSDFAFTKIEDIEKLTEIISSHIAKFEIVNLETLLSGWTQSIEASINGERHPIIEKLLLAINKRNTTAWEKRSR